jgi:hypothetical protein
LVFFFGSRARRERLSLLLPCDKWTQVKFHRAAAIALVGWYLMAPHVYYDPHAAKPGYSGWMKDGDADSSLSAWQLIASYDTAAECETARDELQRGGNDFDIVKRPTSML